MTQQEQERKAIIEVLNKMSSLLGGYECIVKQRYEIVADSLIQRLSELRKPSEVNPKQYNEWIVPSDRMPKLGEKVFIKYLHTNTDSEHFHYDTDIIVGTPDGRPIFSNTQYDDIEVVGWKPVEKITEPVPLQGNGDIFEYDDACYDAYSSANPHKKVDTLKKTK